MKFLNGCREMTKGGNLPNPSVAKGIKSETP